MGKLRDSIMEYCDSVHIDDMSSLIDDIEYTVKDARDHLSVDCIDDLAHIPTALEILDKLEKDLY